MEQNIAERENAWHLIFYAQAHPQNSWKASKPSIFFAKYLNAIHE
jgi:hypothetical protein